MAKTARVTKWALCGAGCVYEVMRRRCTVLFLRREQKALPLTPQRVFLSPRWTTAWWDPYLVIVGGGKSKALKAHLCGDAIRQTAVGPRYLPPLPVLSPSCPIFLIAILLFKNHKEMLLEESGDPRMMFVCWKLFGGPLGTHAGVIT